MIFTHKKIHLQSGRCV